MRSNKVSSQPPSNPAAKLKTKQGLLWPQCTKLRTIQRRLAWPQLKDDTEIRKAKTKSRVMLAQTGPLAPLWGQGQCEFVLSEQVGK